MIFLRFTIPRDSDATTIRYDTICLTRVFWLRQLHLFDSASHVFVVVDRPTQTRQGQRRRQTQGQLIPPSRRRQGWLRPRRFGG